MSRGYARASLTIAGLALAGCVGGSVDRGDVGIRVPDSGADAAAMDAGAAPYDAGPDAYVSPWRPPAFEPHLVESHPEVVCQPLDLGFDTPVREPAQPGDVRWVYEIDQDAGLRDLLRRTGSTSTQIEDDGLTGTTTGGVSFHVGPNAEVGITSTGTVAFVTPRSRARVGPRCDSTAARRSFRSRRLARTRSASACPAPPIPQSSFACPTASKEVPPTFLA